MEDTPKKDWLKRLQNESWEPEILISGIVIYGLFKILPYLDELHQYLENYGSAFFGSSTADDTVVALIQLSISWLIVGFITHLFLRGFWVAYIGLSYVYGNEIDFKKLKYHKSYLKSINRDNRITSNIERLESICSSIFAVSILFFMNVLGLIFFTCVVGFGVFAYIEFFPVESNFIYFDYVLQVFLLICAIDYMTSRLFKRLPYINKVFYPIYKIISFLTLAPLYRKIYYTFICNHSKWKVFLVLSIFIVVSFYTMIFIRDGFGNTLSLRPNTLTENVIAPRNYLDEAEGKYSNIIWIPSQKVESNTLEAFVVHTPANEDRHIKPLCDFTNKVKQDNADLGQIKLDCLNQFYHLELNEIPVSTQAFYTRNNKTGQDGLKYFIPIDTLNRGRHVLKLFYINYNSYSDTIYKNLQSKVEFYKSSNKTTQIVGE